LETYEKIKKEIDFAYGKGINGTPATMIGNDVYVGIKPYEEFVKWVEKLGAEKR